MRTVTLDASRSMALRFAAALVALLAAAAVSATTPKSLRVALDAPGQAAIGDTVLVGIRVTGADGADYFDVDVTGAGLLAASRFSRQPVGADVFLEVGVRLLDEPSGELAVAAVARTNDGREIGQARAELFAVRSGSRAHLSRSSATDARLRALETGASLPGGAGEVSRAPAVETRATLPALRRRVAEQAIDEALEPEVRLQPADASAPPTAQALVAVTVRGRALWTDAAGNTHALPAAVVEVYDDEGAAAPQLLGTTATNATGDYSIAVSDDDGPTGGPDVFVRVLTRSTVADIRPVGGGAAQTYFMQSATHADQPSGAILVVNLTASNTTESGQAFSVHHALVAGGVQIARLNGSAPALVVTRFPTNEATSLFNGSELHVLRLDRWDWDVIQHEYGHYVMDAYNFESNPGGSHSFNTNMSATRGKDAGVRLAWGEGWPTYFAVSGQRTLGLASLGIANVGDLSYQDTEDSTLNVALESSTGVGEDDELSVIAALWDLVDGADDGEDLSVDPASLFATIKGGGITTIGGLWNALTTGSANEEKTRHGRLFGLDRIAPQQLTPGDRAALNTSTVFGWVQNGAGTVNPLNAMHVRFFDGTFTSETRDANVGNTNTFTPSQADVDAATSQGSLVRAVVTGSNTAAPATPGASQEYWSDQLVLNGAAIAFVIDDTGSMEEEIAGVRDALTAFIDSLAGGLPAGAQAPTIHLLTFKDGVTHRITSSDLAAVRTAVSLLEADGGGDCPEAGSQALKAASELVRDGGTILFATDASSQPGVDVGALVAALRSRGVTVNTILSGDCADEVEKPSALRASAAQQKPGDDAQPGGQITNPGVADVADFVGDDIDTATQVQPGEIVVGSIEESADVDVYAFDVEAFRDYALFVEGGPEFFTVDFLGAGGDAVEFNVDGFRQPSILVSTGSETAATGVAPANVRYYLRFRSFFPDQSYRFVVTPDPFATLASSSVQLFSIVSGETNGVFASIDEINFDDDAAYVNTIFNILRSSLDPAVVSSSIRDLPRGASLAVTLTGRRTNWGTGTTVSLVKAGGGAPAGLTLQNATVTSPTTIKLLLAVAANAELVDVDVETSTPIGGTSQRAAGIGVLRVVEAPPGPQLLGADPDRVIRGTSATLAIQGVNTAFTAGAQVTLGSGITVNSVARTSATELAVNVTVADDALLGFRSVEVTDGGTLTLEHGILVAGANVVPVIAQVTPAQVRRTQTVSVTVSGSGTSFASGVTTADFGPDVTVDSLTVNGPTEAVVGITVGAGAALGFRSVTLTTGAESATLLNGLFVDTAQATPQTPPTAAIAPKAAANEGATVALDGTQSSDADGTITAYLWEQTAGPAAAIAAPTAASTTFVAPQVTAAATLTFRLTVTDDDGLKSSTTADFTVNDVPPAVSPPAPSGDSDGGGGGCFIATAAYGSYLDPHVQVLREFRDRRLLTNAAGRVFVDFYYRYSPPIAEELARHDGLRLLVRWVLTPVVYAILYPLASSALTVIVACALAGWIVRRNRHRRALAAA